ncbi:MAG: maltose alpha-D-glucosyltransferase, partial [Spirochaetes bacterium]|nr:maltose alpha-D-glucosyltransferase [Spirochaetota bacterium]
MSVLWFKNAIFYELYIRGFMDSNKDGHGDINGIILKLDYLKELGIDCIWLLPMYPTPSRDDGYDIMDYENINPQYGTLNDFKKLVKEAHKREIRILSDLVLNHTSDKHPWFIEAKKGPKSPYFDYYVWSKTVHKYKEARIIFIDSEVSNWTFCEENGYYYWHRFFYHQPDLNFDNPKVQEEMVNIIKFWLDLGLDGLRVDAVPYLFEREGTNCENLPETHEYIKKLRKFIDENYNDKILLAEANQWPEDLKAYFGEGDEFHMAFNFPLMPRIFMSIKQEHHGPIVDIMKRLPEIPETCQWATFLRNHDELTLEMCTDQERDYMYKEFAHDKQMKINKGIRRRLAPLMENDYRKIHLMNALLLSLPGTPVIYYGDEIGMGDNIYLGDRNGVRTPMHWDQNKNAGFSDAKPSQIYAPIIIDPEYNYNSINVEAQRTNPNSIFNFMKKLIKTWKKFKAFGNGNMVFIYPENKKILVFLREYNGEILLCTFNLSGTSQPAEINLSNYNGYTPVEIFNDIRFPKIGELPYLLTFFPYGFFV